MANEFIKAMQVQAVTPGTLQFNGIQPATVTLASVDNSAFAVAVTTDLSDPLSQYAVGTPLWVRIDDVAPNMGIPLVGTSTSESTASVVTDTVAQPYPVTAV